MKKAILMVLSIFIFSTSFMVLESAWAEEATDVKQGGDADLAQELTNPLADLLTIPI